MKKVILLVIASLGLFSTNAQSTFDFIDEFGSLKKNWAIVSQDNCHGIINKQGELVVPVSFDYIEEFGSYSRNLAIISYNDKVGLINRKGKIVLAPVFDYI